MIYFICPTNSRHINWAFGEPSNDWVCGWPNCGARLQFSYLAAVYVYPKAPMYAAIYAPGGGQVNPLQLSHYQQHHQAQNQQPQPLPQTQNQSMEMEYTTISTTIPQTPLPVPTFGVTPVPTGPPTPLQQFVNSNRNDITPPELLELAFHPPKLVITEQKSQNALYVVLADKGFLFLLRNGSFGPYKEPTSRFDPDETVPEPAVTKSGYAKHMVCSWARVGRHEVDPWQFGKGAVTYPDYVVTKSNIVYYIELKTPRSASLKNYLSEHFYIEQVFSGKSVLEELEYRRGLTAKEVEMVLLFDLRNTVGTGDDAIKDLKNSIEYNTARKNWWLKNVNGVMFYRTEGLSKMFSVDEILAGQSITNSTQQKNLKAFFLKK